MALHPRERNEVLLSDVLTPLRDYLEHGSWRCSDHGRYPVSTWGERGDCYCGLVGALVEAGCSLPEALHIAGPGAPQSDEEYDERDGHA